MYKLTFAAFQDAVLIVLALALLLQQSTHDIDLACKRACLLQYCIWNVN